MTRSRYSYQFIEKSIQKGRLEDLEAYKAGPSTTRPVGATNIPTKGQRAAFTIEEDQLIYDYMQHYERDPLSSVMGNKIYQLFAANVIHLVQYKWHKLLLTIGPSTRDIHGNHGVIGISRGFGAVHVQAECQNQITLRLSVKKTAKAILSLRLYLHLIQWYRLLRETRLQCNHERESGNEVQNPQCLVPAHLTARRAHSKEQQIGIQHHQLRKLPQYLQHQQASRESYLKLIRSPAPKE